MKEFTLKIKGGLFMPNWLHNTLFVFLLIITFGCVSSGIEWKSNKKEATEE